MLPRRPWRAVFVSTVGCVSQGGQQFRPPLRRRKSQTAFSVRRRRRRRRAFSPPSHRHSVPLPRVQCTPTIILGNIRGPRRFATWRYSHDDDDAKGLIIFRQKVPGSCFFVTRRCPWGAFINDIRKIFGFFDPLPPCPHLVLTYTLKFTQPPLLHLLFHDPPLMRTSYL